MFFDIAQLGWKTNVRFQPIRNSEIYSNSVNCNGNVMHRQTVYFSAWTRGLYPLSGRTSYHKISWSPEAPFRLFNRAEITSAAAPPKSRCLWNFRAMRCLQHPISLLRYFTKYCGKTSNRLVNRGPGPLFTNWRLITRYSEILSQEIFCKLSDRYNIHLSSW